MNQSETKVSPDRNRSPFIGRFVNWWEKIRARYPGATEFLLFFIVSNGVTLLQILLMPTFKEIFEQTNLVHTAFQIWPVGQNLDGSTYYIFDYPAGLITTGGGGGLAYFFAVQITLLVAQVVNFFLQRNVTFRSNTSIWWAALWYLIAYVVITIVAAAAQGLYKVPIYNLFIDLWGKTGETIADVITMIIYSAISYWVFFPIFKVIFRREPAEQDEAST